MTNVILHDQWHKHVYRYKKSLIYDKLNKQHFNKKVNPDSFIGMSVTKCNRKVDQNCSRKLICYQQHNLCLLTEKANKLVLTPFILYSIL